jgi:hypothetical protein
MASSCGDDDGGAEATPRRTTTTEAETTTTLDPAEAERQEVIAAYEAAEQAEFSSASAPAPDPDDPAIEATHTGLMLDYWVSVVEGLQRTGVAFRLPEGSQYRYDVDSMRFDEVNGQEVAYLEICTLTDEERFVMGSGEVAEGGLRTIQSSDAMVQEDGVWKLAEHRVNTTMEGVAGCAAD